MAELTPELAEMVSRRFRALGDPTRLLLLSAIHARGEASVGELVEALGGTQANISKHLRLLLAERLVGRRREGPRALYRIADPGLMAICDEVCAGVRDGVRELSEIVDDRIASAR